MFWFLFNTSLGMLFPLTEEEEQLALESINMLNVQYNKDFYVKSPYETPMKYNWVFQGICNANV